MGNNGAKLPAAAPEMPYFLIMLQPPNRLKVALADEETMKIVMRACQEAWPHGIHTDHRTGRSVYKVKFIGNPFNSATGSNSTNAKYLIVRILSSLYESGWRLAVSSELSKGCEASTLFFRRCSPRRREEVYCKGPIVGFSMPAPDRIQLINADKIIVDLTRRIASEHYTPGIGREIEHENGYDIVLREKAWLRALDELRNPDVSFDALKFLLAMIRELENNGYEIYGTANVGNWTNQCIFFVEGEKVLEGLGEDDQEDVCLVSLVDEDELVLVDAPEAVVNTTRTVIMDTWPGGIQQEQMQSQRTWFTIKGQPWRATGPDVVGSHRFISNLFRALLSRGWRVEQTINIGQAGTAVYLAFLLRSSLRHCFPHACINLNNVDKIRIIGDGSWVVRHQSAASLPASPQDATYSIGDSMQSLRQAEIKIRRRHSSSSRRRLAKSVKDTLGPSSRPPLPRLLITPPSDEHLPNSASSIPQSYLEIIQVIRSAVEKYWPYGIDRERDYYGCRELRLQGSPWSALSASGGNRPLMARVMMCSVFKAINDAGWHVYASASISASKSHNAAASSAVTSTSSSVSVGTRSVSAAEVHSWFIAYDSQ